MVTDMDPNMAAWSGDLTGFGNSMDNGHNGEDWEDWLRWDPAADATSPDNGTFNSGSSKNDSPIQGASLPVPDDIFGKDGATIAPPLIIGDDSFDFTAAPIPEKDAFLFGAGDNLASGFDMDASASFQPMPPNMPNVGVDWSMVPDAPLKDVTLSALSAQPKQTFPSATATVSTPSFNHYSPDSSSQPRRTNSDSGTSPEAPPKKRGGRKRKAEAEQEQQEENVDSQDGDEPPMKKTSHNVIEKRYRNNLNDKIVELRNSVPSLRALGRASGGKGEEDLEGLTPAHKLNKATVMAKATEYIRHLEKRNNTMADEMEQLQARLAAVEAAIGRSRDRQSSMSTTPSGGSTRTREPSTSSQSGAPGFLVVPQEQARYSQQTQQPYMQQQQQPVYSRAPNPPVEAQNQPQSVNGRGGGVMNKVMLGAMAGIMVMEGFSDNQDDTQGLLAVPGSRFKRGLADATSSPAGVARHAGMPLLKIFCVIGAVLYLIAPFLASSPNRKQKTRPVVQLPQAPSLASPVEVRRKAWLTAMQTVYVPKHFLLEVVAVGAKMFKLSLRRAVGTQIWNATLGINQEEEAARIKAWDIAIDAQLAGGDAEVSYYRLLLTLMTSGTLPDSPTRLMQKAVHFRVFFWELSNAGYGNILGFREFTEKVGKIYWDSARRLQKELVQSKLHSRSEFEDIETLPDHLARLIELECYDVLNDEMIQRAWNLAWNKSSAFGTLANAARDSVIEDHAIRSPLDAVAAWYANVTIDDVLLDNLAETPSSLDTEYYLNLANSISPPASATQVRALAAKAVLSITKREANIMVALETLPPTGLSGTGTMNIVSHAPAAPDVRLALTMAKLLSLLGPQASASAHSRAHETIACLRLAPGSFTLLTAVAAYRLMRLISSSSPSSPRLPAGVAHGLEDMASSLRLWIGTSAGRDAGLGHDDCGRVVDLCLAVAKRAGGWSERDSGYGSVEVSPVRAKGERFAAF